MKNKIFILLALLLASATTKAQMLTVNDQKSKIETSYQYRGGTPIEGACDGHNYTNMGVWHNFVFSPLRRYGIEFHHQFNDGASPYGSGHNNYLRMGINGQEVIMLKGYKGIALTANLYMEGSQKGFKHFDGVVSTLFMYNMAPKDTRSVGFIWLVNNPMKMLCLPIMIWKKKWNDKFDLDFMTYLATFNYHPLKRLTISAAYATGFERYWGEYNGQEAMYNRVYFTPSVSARVKILKNLDVAVIGGGQIPIMGSIYNSKGTETLAKLRTYKSAFVQGQIYYNF